MPLDILFPKSLKRGIAIEGRQNNIKSVIFLPPHTKRREESLTLEISFSLERYFQGEKIDFEFETDLSGLTPFQRNILKTACQIKHGETTSYSGIAEMAGTKAIRSVGTALSRNPLPILIPCHRILSKKGLGGYSAGLEIKKRLLHLEGHSFKLP